MRITKGTKTPSGAPKNPKISLIALLILIIFIAIIILFSGCSKEKKLEIDINEYLIPELTGYNEYGSISFDLDYEAMFRNIPVANDTKAKAEANARTFELFVAEYDNSNKLKNGDVVSIKWKKNDGVLRTLESALDISFIYDDYSQTISELEDVRDYDPFEDLYIDTKKSASGVGEIDFAIHCEINGPDIIWQVAHDGENGKLKNGDVLNLTIVDEIDAESFIRNTGLRVTRTECEFKVQRLCEPAIDEEILNHIGDKEKLAFSKVVNDWVVSGLNDENLNSMYRAYELDGYVFYTDGEVKRNDDGTVANLPDGMLIAIYKIEDYIVDGGYYVFIGLEGKLTFDDDGIYINNGETLPDSFVYYEKETIRYSHQFGWGQNYEPMGFLYEEMPYAGHRDIQETFDYIEKTYGKNYTYRFMSDVYDGVISERVIEE